MKILREKNSGPGCRLTCCLGHAQAVEHLAQHRAVRGACQARQWAVRSPASRGWGETAWGPPQLSAGWILIQNNWKVCLRAICPYHSVSDQMKKTPNWCNQILGAREVHNQGADQPGHLFRLLWTSPQRRTGGNRSLFKVCFECAACYTFVLFVKESIQNSLSICWSQGRGGRQEVVGLEGQGGGA